MQKIVCPCGKEVVVVTPSRIGRTKYCCKACFYLHRKRPNGLSYKIVSKNKGWFKKGHKISVGRIVSSDTRRKISQKNKGRRNSPNTEFKKGETEGAKNHKWKGNDVGYGALHGWVRRHLGKPNVCSKCGSRKRVEWANRTWRYLRDPNDWIKLCFLCHRKYDRGENWGKARTLFSNGR